MKRVLRPYVLAARRVRAERPTSTALAFSQARSYSQFGEDRYLLGRFADKTDGFFVDVGAYHPFSLSNTCLLYERGWRGINLEPAPDGFAEFRRWRPRDINLPLAVSPVPGCVEFVVAGAFAGIADSSHLWGDMGARRIRVRTEPLSSILDEHLPSGQEIDLLDVDCEGHDLEVLKSNDWDRYRPKVILAEAHREDDAAALDRYLDEQGYGRESQLDLTLVYSRAG